MRRIYLIAVLSLLGLAAIASTLGLGVGRASAERAAAERRQIHILEVLVDAKTLSVAVRDMQRGQRGYLLTENPDYLAPYE